MMRIRLRALLTGSLMAGSVVVAPMLSTAWQGQEPGSLPRRMVEIKATSPVSAATALGNLPVKGRAPKTGYSRARFGSAWVDVDRNDCDTRNDILRRDLVSVTLAGDGCVVLSGELADPYSGQGVTFRRGTGTSTVVQIDHVVSLGDAWVKGAQRLTKAGRLKFANDPLNLVAVRGSLNQQKGAGDAATWLPPLKSYRCEYVARQIAVKRIYRLWVTPAERQTMSRILAACPAQDLPPQSEVEPPDLGVDGSPPPTSAPSATPAPSAEPDPVRPEHPGSTPPMTIAPSPTQTVSAGTDPRFSTCAKAKAAGYGPYRRGIDPEYAWYRDADSDGIVCE